MPLYRHGALAADDWTFPVDGAPLPEFGRLALPKERFLAERDLLMRRGDGIGLILVAGQGLAGLEADIGRVGLIALRFPRYADGRLYSVARLLRDRYAYRGELRATGDVLRDQIVFMLRAGFDAFDVTDEGTSKALAARHIVAVHHHYQPASSDGEESRAGARPWLRRSKPVGEAWRNPDQR